MLYLNKTQFNDYILGGALLQYDERDIVNALKNEALARCQYEIYAEIAHGEGLHYFGKILEETASNELSHVREIMGVLGLLKSTKENLAAAIESESEESETLYPNLQKAALIENDLDTARLFQQIAKIESRHLERFEKLAALLESNSVYKRDYDITWKCRTCGYIHIGKEPPNKCPGCQSHKDCYEPADFSI